MGLCLLSLKFVFNFRLKSNGCLKLGDVTTVNLTMLEVGTEMVVYLK